MPGEPSSRDIRADSEDSQSGDGKKKDDKKGATINRVNRACNHCRRMKMRCIGAEDPPCKRCRNAGLECVMEKPGRPPGDVAVGEDRIRSLESQMSSMQNTLIDLVSTIRAGLPTQPAQQATPAQQSTASNDIGSSSSWPFPPPTPQGPTPQVPLDFSSLLPGQNFGFPPRQEIVAPRFDISDSGSEQSPYHFPQLGHMPNPFQPMPPHQSQQFQQSGFLGPIKSPLVSLSPSRAESVGAEDILAPEEITNPLGALSNMAGLVEAAVERARDERFSPADASASSKRDFGLDDTRPAKRTRFSPEYPTGPVITESQHLPPTASTKDKKRSVRTHIHAYPDAVAEGYVSESEARELVKIFYAGSSNFIPCFDPGLDNWDSLRSRSPFSLTTMIMVGARVRDGGGPQSDVQRACRAHAQRIAVGTLFNPVARIEAVQAMTVLAAFSEHGWLPGGHAVRMAIDMGINRSFVHLLKTGMGKGKSREALEEERHLVVHSRTWFCLYLVEHQMAYGMGRPAILREDESIHNCRRLLEHPLSITSDARLVSTVELMALRAPLHIELTASPDLPLTDKTLKRLKQANKDFDAWERYWDRILSDRFGKGRGDFFRESLVIQRQYAELFVNSQLLRGIREPSDVIGMPEEQRALAIKAMRNAQKALEICLKGENYRNGLRYAVHYSHVCAAFAASFLIRIARLFPHELQLKKTGKDVEELANLLSEIPAGRYARSLRLILRRARRARVIPANSTVVSPRLGSMTLMGHDGSSANAMAGPSTNTVAFSPSQLVNPGFYPTPTGGSHVSPGMSLLTQAGQIINDSPSSGGDGYEFDSLFAQETMERAGLKFGEGDSLPLFLDGQSLGGTAGATEMTPYVGIESFFLPAEVDGRLGGTDQNGMSGDVWW